MCGAKIINMLVKRERPPPAIYQTNQYDFPRAVVWKNALFARNKRKYLVKRFHGRWNHLSLKNVGKNSVFRSMCYFYFSSKFQSKKWAQIDSVYLVWWQNNTWCDDIPSKIFDTFYYSSFSLLKSLWSVLFCRIRLWINFTMNIYYIPLYWLYLFIVMYSRNRYVSGEFRTTEIYWINLPFFFFCVFVDSAFHRRWRFIKLLYLNRRFDDLFTIRLLTLYPGPVPSEIPWHAVRL